MQKKILYLSIVFSVVWSAATSQHRTVPVQLTFESDQAISEDSVFQSLNSIRRKDKNRSSSGYYSGVLSTLLVNKTQSVPIQVNQGDDLSLEAYAHYEKSGNKKLLKNLAIAIGAGLVVSQVNQGVLKGEGKKDRSVDKLAPLAAGSAIAIPALAKQLKGKPRAVIKWELYDEDRKFVIGGDIIVDKTAKNSWQHIQQQISVSVSGYIIVSLINESATPVWFDDIELKSNTIQEVAVPKFSKLTILSMSNNLDAGCGDLGDECDPTDPLSDCYDFEDCESLFSSFNCTSEFSCPYGATMVAECRGDACFECLEPNPCADDPFSCECNPVYCDSGGSGGGGGGIYPEPEDPCWTDTYSCECNPANCQPDPCETNPYSCECNSAYCQPDPGPVDCAGVAGGSAWINTCNQCVGGTTGRTNSWIYYDSDGDGWGDPNVKYFCYDTPGDKWVSKGYDYNDNCYDLQNSSTQCSASECESLTINEMMSFSLNKQSLMNLHNSVLQGDNFERGMAVFKDSHGEIYLGPEEQGAPNDPQVNLSLISPTGDELLGYVHSHYEGTDYVFSADDLYNFFDWSLTNGNGMAGDFMGLVNPNGSAYIATIDDVETLMSFLVDDWDGNPDTPETMISKETFSNIYQSAYGLAQMMYPNDPEKAAELQLLTFLDGIGITLYKASSYDGTAGYQDFSRLDKSGVSVINCN